MSILVTSRDVRSPSQASRDIEVCLSSSVECTGPCTDYYAAQEPDEFSWCCRNTEQHKLMLMVKDHTVLPGRWVPIYCLQQHGRHYTECKLLLPREITVRT